MRIGNLDAFERFVVRAEFVVISFLENAMKSESDSSEPSVDLLMHVCLGVAFLASVFAYVDWPLLVDAMT